MALIEAIKNKDLEKVETVYQKINIKRKRKTFLLACEFGFLEFVEKYILKLRDNYYLIVEASTRAIVNGHLEVLKCIYNSGAIILTCDGEVFLKACANGHILIVEYLMTFFPSKFKLYYNKALKLSALNGHLSLSKYLISIGADVRCSEDEVISNACLNGNMEAIEYFISLGADITTPNTFFNAAKGGHLTLVKYLVSLGLKNDYATFYASEFGHFEVLKYLVEEVGSDIQIGNSCGVRYAARNGHLHIVKYLYERGANIRSENDMALQKATENGHYEVVQYLCEKGAYVQASSNYAICTAAYKGCLSTVKILHEMGADIRSRNYSPIKNAAAYGRLDVVKYLHKVGQIKIPHDAVYMACKNNHLEVVKYIYENVTDIRKDDCMQIASEYGHLQIVKYLYENGVKIKENYELCKRYISFFEKMKNKLREKAQRRIYFWWIPICYDVNHEIGKRMMLKNLEKAKELGMEFSY